MKTGAKIFLQRPESEGNLDLFLATIAEVDGDSMVLVVENTEFKTTPGLEIILLYDVSRDFVRQPAKVMETSSSAEGQIIGLTTTGDPLSAESREHYRVSTLSSDLHVRIVGADTSGDELLVQDLSATGFAFISPDDHVIGSHLEVELQYQDRSCAGRVQVQSQRFLSSKRTRHGVRCIGEGAEAIAFSNHLSQLSLLVQREQLSRS